MSSSLAYTPLNEIPAVGEISNRNKNNNFSRQAPDNKNINGNKLNPNSNLNIEDIMKSEIFQNLESKLKLEETSATTASSKTISSSFFTVRFL